MTLSPRVRARIYVKPPLNDAMTLVRGSLLARDGKDRENEGGNDDRSVVVGCQRRVSRSLQPRRGSTGTSSSNSSSNSGGEARLRLHEGRHAQRPAP